MAVISCIIQRSIFQWIHTFVSFHLQQTHYISTSSQGTGNTADGGGNDSLSGKSQSSSTTESTTETQKKAKQAVVYTWAMFTTSAKEIVVAPALLDFLEQALESVPASVPGFNSTVSDGKGNSFIMNRPLAFPSYSHTQKIWFFWFENTGKCFSMLAALLMSGAACVSFQPTTWKLTYQCIVVH